MPRAARAMLAAALCLAILTPTQAFAKRYGSDEICGVRLESSKLDRDAAPDVNAAAGAIVTADGRILWSRKTTTPRPMASITKIMTALLVLERGDLDDEVTVSRAASKVPYAVGLKEGERRTVRELLELALVASSNDAAYALAEHVGGGATEFVALMNQRAAELGLNDTHFVNPHGLDAAGHRSSASDIVSLTHTAMRIPRFRQIVALRSVTLPAHKKRPARKLKATNELLGTYPGLLGGKTGFTDDAKYGLVTCAERNGIGLTAVVLGAKSNSARFKNSRRLLDWGFKHLRMQTVATATETVGVVPISAAPERTVTVRFAETTSTPVFDLDGPVERKLSLPATVKLPVFEGQPLGTVDLMQGERPLAAVPVVAAEDLASVGETVGAVPVADYLDRAVPVRAADESASVAAFDPAVAVERTVKLDERLSAPVATGTRVGEIVYSQAGTVIVRVPVVAAASVEAPGLLTRIGTWFARGWRTLLGEPTMASVQVAS